MSSTLRWPSAMAAAIALLLLATLAVVVAARQSLLGLLPDAWRIELMAIRHGVTVDHGQRVTTPDGITLAASLFRPKGTQERLPTILIRLPYHRQRYGEGYSGALYFAPRGYAVLVQDLRGTGDSDGDFLPWAHAADDMVATIDWISRQPWSDGNVGTLGCSALGETQLVSQDRALGPWRAMVASGAGGAVGSLAGRNTYFGVFEGGIFQLATGFGWFVDWGTLRPDAAPARPFDRATHLRDLPVASLIERVRPAPNGYHAFLTTPLGDAKWSEWGYLDDSTRLRIPALIVNTWGDQTVQDTLTLVEHWRSADPDGTQGRQKVIISAGNHCNHEEVGVSSSFGELSVANAGRPYRELYLRWFDYWLRGRGDALKDMSPYTFYVVGADTWLQSESWPPATARAQRWFLGSDGHANSRSGNGRLMRLRQAGATGDTWRYDPENPAPSIGGPICCTGNPADRSGPAEQTGVEERDDVLVYTSQPAQYDLWIAGPIKARLTVSSAARDTDLVARLVHVWPDGRATSIQEGALRLRYRNGFSSPELLEPGKPVHATVDMRSIAYRLPAGHRLRLDLTSSSFPRLERNLNTGGDNARETRSVVATNHVHYDVGEGSWIELHVLPKSP